MGPTDADFRRFSNFFAIFAKHAKYTILHSTQYQSKERGRRTLPGRGSHINFHEIQLKNAPGARIELATSRVWQRTQNTLNIKIFVFFQNQHAVYACAGTRVAIALARNIIVIVTQKTGV